MISNQMLEGENPEDLISSIYMDHEQVHETASMAAWSQSELTANYYPSIKSLLVVSHSTTLLCFDDCSSETSSLPQRIESDSSSVKVEKSHWKPASHSSTCFNSNCLKKITLLERPHNCYMCGEVFCKRCTNYRRKLSTSAHPDPFGTFCNVCCKCFNHHTAFGGCRDLMGQFSEIRRNKLSAETKEATKTLCGGRTSISKRMAMTGEIERLKKGFSTNAGILKELMSEMKVPKWQKSDNWVRSRDASECYQCQKAFTKLSHKSHCRIGGQVFCPNCSKDEIVVYLEERDGEPKWGVNGKSGGPQSTPVRFEMYPICLSCSTELQSMLQDSASLFMKDIYNVHQTLSTLQTKVKDWLSVYKQIVNEMDGLGNGPQSIAGGTYALAKARCDLSDALTVFSVQSQKLKRLRPNSPCEIKLHKWVMIGIHRFYKEHKDQFRHTCERLNKHMSPKHLLEIQKQLSQLSMKHVHTAVQQLMYEALNLEKRYKLDMTIFHDIIHSIEEEFKPILEEEGPGESCSWSEHLDAIRLSIKEEIKSNRLRIKLSPETLSSPDDVKYVVISQSSSVVQECYRELQAKTMDREFPKTKRSFNDARLKLDEAL